MLTGLLTEHKHAWLTKLNNKYYDTRNSRKDNSIYIKIKIKDNLKTVDIYLHSRVRVKP